MKQGVICLLAAFTLLWAPAARAADNSTEFGVEDDLTVLGTGGTAVDPDLEVKGFSVFGATQSAPALNIPAAAGNVFVNGHLQVSSGMYVTSGSTFTGTMYATGVSSFTGKVYMQNNQEIRFSSPTYIYMDGGSTGQVLKKDASGSLKWAEDVSGAGAITGTPNRIQKIDASGTGLVDSAFVQNGNGDGQGITIVGGSSLTISGQLKSVGDADLDAKLNVDGAATFVSSITARGAVQMGETPASDHHSVNMLPSADTGLAVAGEDVAGKFAAKFYSGANLAAWIRKK